MGLPSDHIINEKTRNLILVLFSALILLYNVYNGSKYFTVKLDTEHVVIRINRTLVPDWEWVKVIVAAMKELQ